MSDDCTHLKPAATFYLLLLPWNSDGTIDLRAEAPTASTEIAQILEAAKEACESGGRAYVYECRAIRQVDRGSIRVTTLPRRR